MNAGYGPQASGSADAVSAIHALTGEQRCGKYAGLSWEADGASVRATGVPASRAQFEEWCRDLATTPQTVTFRGECATARGHRCGVTIHLIAAKPHTWWNR